MQIELPPQITILYFVVPAVVFGLGILFVRSLLRRGSLLLASLALPVYWVAYEYLTAITSPHSTWGNLAYTQMNCLPVIQIAAITGLWGISFIVFLFAAAVAALLSGAGGPWQRRAVAIGVGFVICAVFVFGKWRLQSNPPAQSVTVTLIAKDVPMSVYLGSEEQALRIVARVCCRNPPHYSSRNAGCCFPGKNRTRQRELHWQKWTLSSLRLPLRRRAAIVLGLVRKMPSGAFNSSRYVFGRRKIRGEL